MSHQSCFAYLETLYNMDVIACTGCPDKCLNVKQHTVCEDIEMEKST